MAVLILAELNGNDLSEDATSKAVSAAKGLGDIHVLCASSNCSSAATSAAKLNGVSKVLCVDSEVFGNGMAEPIADLVVSMSGDYEHIMAPATNSAKNILPRVAALLDVMVITDITGVIDSKTFERPIYAGNAIQTVESSDHKKIVSVRTANFDAVDASGNATIENIDSKVASSLAGWMEDKVAASDRPELTSAGAVVSGGRGVGSDADFALIEKLADKLGAAVGASRAAVDSGYAPNDWQVGQTGKVVAPDLYVAVGISGAIQHLAGMKDSKVIVAINKDEEAPIFQVADLGLVADLFEAVPSLTDKL